MKPLCVRHRKGWCAVKDQTLKPEALEGIDNIETACGYFIVLAWGVKRRAPDCAECAITKACPE